MEELLEVLKGIKPEIDFENEENLIEDELLDSFDIISIVAAIDDECKNYSKRYCSRKF